jgi:thiazole/oxazole-forming peptide maturase SagD family component
MFDSKSQPLANLFSYQEDDCLCFLSKNGLVKVSENAANYLAILKHCNGYNTLPEIQNLSGLESVIFEELITNLFHNSIVVDSRNIFSHFHEFTKNPMHYYFDLNLEQIQALEKAKSVTINPKEFISLDADYNTSLTNLFSERKTSRDFSGKPLSLQTLSGLTKALTKSNSNYSYPSAGGIYPLKSYVVLLKAIDEIEAGIYECCPNGLEKVESSQALSFVFLALGQKQGVQDAAAVVIITADLSAHGSKYSNRGYRYTILEAGHVAQNVNLFCTEQGLGVWEYGGFDDDKTLSFLNLKSHIAVLTTVIVGSVGTQDQTLASINQLKDDSWLLRNNLCGINKPILNFSVDIYSKDGYTMPLFCAKAEHLRLNDLNSGTGNSFATSENYDEVVVKVLAEGFERYASGKLRIDVQAKTKDLNGLWLHPNQLFPLNETIFKTDKELHPFSEDKVWDWVIGHNLSGEKLFIPVDCVFYPLNEAVLGRKPCLYASSNGAAAHFDRNKAVQNGLMELIERDAIMVHWFGGLMPKALPIKNASDMVLHRVRHWQNKGWQVKFINYTLDSVPVVGVFIWSEANFPHLATGGAAAFTFETAIEKAFNEAEYMLLSWMDTEVERITKQKVVTPNDHGILYFNPEHFNEIKEYLDAGIEEVDMSSNSDLNSLFEPIVVDLHNPTSSSQLWAVQVLSTKLMPINFGYGYEAYKHPRIQSLGLQWSREYPSFPHYVA